MKNSMESEENLGSGPYNQLLGTLDPDYVSPPDSKKIKLMKEKGEEELYGRTVKVIEKHVLNEISDLTLDLEDIDERILKVQQFLHTLRFQASLNLYVYEKVKDRVSGNAKTSRLNHPTLRRHLGDDAESPADLPTAECLSKYQIKEELNPSVSIKRKECSRSEIQNEEKVSKIVPRESTLIQDGNCEVISQGRKEKFQKQMKIIIGNTYQYLKDSERIDEYMRFKWRVYVRSFSKEICLSSFISSVTFKLDESYAPHHIIRVREPPFSICRKGWGEFKIFVEFEFTDQRNKSIQLIHPLTLARMGDPLSVTGLWRLGKEVMYNIWLYDKSDESFVFHQPERQESSFCKDSLITKLEEQGLNSDTTYSDAEGNLTLSHTKVDEELSAVKKVVDSGTSCLPEQSMIANTKEVNVQSLNSIENGSNTSLLNENYQPLINQECMPDNDTVSNVITTTSKNVGIESFPKSSIPSHTPEEKSNLANANTPILNQMLLPLTNIPGEDQRKIFVRQTDGSLVSIMVPEKMYNMAVKMSAEKDVNKADSEGSKARINSPKALEFSHNLVKKVVISKNPSTQAIRSSTSLTYPLVNRNIKSCNTVSSPLSTNQLPLKLKSNAMTLPKAPLIQTSRGTLLRLTPVQNPVTTNSNTFIQPLVPQTKNIKTRPSNIPIPQGKVTKIRVSNQNILKHTLRSMPRGQGPIKLTLNNGRINSQNLLRVGNPLITKLPLSTATKNLIQFNTQGTSSILKNGLTLNNKRLIYSMKNVKNLSNVHLSTRGVLPTGTKSLLNGDSAYKVPTRRIYISAPPNLIKIRETESNKTENAVKESLLQQQIKAKKCNKVCETSPSETELFEERKRWLRSQSKGCSTVEEVLHIYLKGIPLVANEAGNDSRFPYMAPSIDSFRCYLLGRKRAIEFWRAREIFKDLKELKTPDWEFWSTYKIVLWARKYVYTPAEKAVNKVLSSERWRENLGTSFLTNTDIEALFHSSEYGSDSIPNLKADEDDSLIKVDDSDHEKEEEKAKNLEESTNSDGAKEGKSIFIVTPLTADENHFIDRTLSTVRVRIEPEEAAPGVKMEVAKSVLWRATMSLMEDLLRSSFAVASSSQPGEEDHETPLSSSLKSQDITLESKHVLSVLGSRRPQFKLLNQFALAKEPLQF